MAENEAISVHNGMLEKPDRERKIGSGDITHKSRSAATHAGFRLTCGAAVAASLDLGLQATSSSVYHQAAVTRTSSSIDDCS